MDFYEYIKDRKEEYILAVTHGNFLKVLICVLLFGDKASGDLLVLFKQHSHIDNTGITVCERKEDGEYF